MRDHEAVTDVVASNESSDITISYGIETAIIGRK